MQPKVSIIIPAYNCDKYISKCIESVSNQSYKNIEIIVINDGSKDKTKEAITALEAKDKRIIHIEQKNSGPSIARNNGISRAIGDYLVFIDSDDTVEENYVEILVKSILSKKSDIVCCGYRDISIYGNIRISDFRIQSNGINKQKFLYQVCQGTGGVLWSKIFKREIIHKYNIKMNKDIFMCEDLIFVLQYGSYCKEFTYIEEYLYNYNRLNDNSISSNISKNYLSNYIEVCKQIENLLLYNNLKKEDVNNIIVNRFQNMVISIIDSEIKNINRNNVKSVAKSIKTIICDEHINLYKNNFKTNVTLNKPYIFFIKKNQVYGCIGYSYILNLLRRLKQSIK